MSNRDTTLSPYFNHELLGAVINAIATSSILKVAQGASGTPGAVAVAQLFDQPKMHVERAAAQPPAAGVSNIDANALLPARGPMERSADDRLDAEMGIRMAASVTRKHHRTQDYIRCRGGAPSTTTTILAIGVVPPRRFMTDYAVSTTAWVSTATCCELAFTAGAESFANAYDTYESPFGDGGIIPMLAGAATHGGDSPSFSQIMKLNSAERQPWEDAMTEEIEGLRQAGAIESEDFCGDSLPSWDGRRATEVIDGLWVSTTARARWRGHPLKVTLRCQ